MAAASQAVGPPSPFGIPSAPRQAHRAAGARALDIERGVIVRQLETEAERLARRALRVRVRGDLGRLQLGAAHDPADVVADVLALVLAFGLLLLLLGEDEHVTEEQEEACLLARVTFLDQCALQAKPNNKPASVTMTA